MLYSGRLALFHYGENLKNVPFFQSDDSRELLRFQALVSTELKMRAFTAKEDILVDSLHLLCEGLVAFNGRGEWASSVVIDLDPYSILTWSLPLPALGSQHHSAS
jgi:hypothetical protein